MDELGSVSWGAKVVKRVKSQIRRKWFKGWQNKYRKYVQLHPFQFDILNLRVKKKEL
jgi:hypothetical protein